MAIGVFWGVTPLLGVQTLLMIGTWQVLKHLFRKDSSVLQAFVWAWINNPLTMIPMYYVFYLTGVRLTGTAASFGGYDAFVALWEESRRQSSNLAGFELLVRQVGLALFVGCMPYALLGSWAAYWWALRMVRARRRLLRVDRAHDERCG